MLLKLKQKNWSKILLNLRKVALLRWLVASEWETLLKCDGNQVAVGSCSSGSHKDCPGKSVHQIKCCDMPDFYFSNCDTFTSDWGQPIDCR